MLFFSVLFCLEEKPALDILHIQTGILIFHQGFQKAGDQEVSLAIAFSPIARVE